MAVQELVYWANAKRNKRVFRACLKPWTLWILLITEEGVFDSEGSRRGSRINTDRFPKRRA